MGRSGSIRPGRGWGSEVMFEVFGKYILYFWFKALLFMIS